SGRRPAPHGPAPLSPQAPHGPAPISPQAPHGPAPRSPAPHGPAPISTFREAPDDGPRGGFQYLVRTAVGPQAVAHAGRNRGHRGRSINRHRLLPHVAQPVL